MSANCRKQLGYLTKDINLYTLFEGMGKSDVGKEMDKMGRYLFNHRFGGGHLERIEIDLLNNGLMCLDIY